MEMVTHQRYVPLLQTPADPLALDAHGVLDPHFLAITNASPLADEALITQGNERVLRARLADGAFFYDQDRSQPLEDYCPVLKGSPLPRGSAPCGTVPTVWCARPRQWPWHSSSRTDTAVNQQALSRAALLCKADLVTQMVGEFPELQGVMGAKYAVASGEGSQVAEAIREHYLPSGADDLLPASHLGRALALKRATGAVGLHLCHWSAAHWFFRSLCPAAGRQWTAPHPGGLWLVPQPGEPAGGCLQPIRQGLSQPDGGPRRPAGGTAGLSAATITHHAGGTGTGLRHH